jgi:tRNA G10  N-methylase Trm11
MLNLFDVDREVDKNKLLIRLVDFYNRTGNFESSIDAMSKYYEEMVNLNFQDTLHEYKKNLEQFGYKKFKHNDPFLNEFEKKNGKIERYKKRHSCEPRLSKED